MAIFLKKFFLFSLAIIATVALINFVIDPTSYFFQKGWHFRSTSNKIYSIEPLVAKPLVISVLTPEMVVVGTSRVARGFEITPDSGFRSGYNMGFPSLQLKELAYLVDDLLHNTNLTNIYIALDIGMFGKLRENRFLLSSFHNPEDSIVTRVVSRIQKYKLLLLSLRVLYPHSRTVRQMDAYGNFSTWVIRSRAGFIDYRKRTQWGEKNYRPHGIAPLGYKNDLQILEELFRKLNKTNATSRIFINPVHVRRMLLQSLAGYKDQYLTILDDISRIYCEQFGSHASRLVVFAGINKVTTEAFPALGDTQTEMDGYYESSHFKPVIGKRILKRLESNTEDLNDFGVSIDCDNRQQFLDEFDQQWSDFEARNPALVKEISGILERQSSR